MPAGRGRPAQNAAGNGSRRFMLYYALIFSLNACYKNFAPLFFSQRGFSQTEVGVLLAGGPMIALLAQPFWGFAADRASSRNRILALLLAGSGGCILLYPLGGGLASALCLLAVFSFFQSAITPVGDAITLDHVQRAGGNYGHIRLFGSLGYAFTSVIAGFVAEKSILIVFGMYALLAVVAALTATSLPQSTGGTYRAGGGYRRVLGAPGVIPVLCLTAFAYAGFGFHASFFGIFLTGSGGSIGLLGICLFLQAVSELPFLFFSRRLQDRWGIPRLLIASTVFMAARWLLMSVAGGRWIILPISLMHGFSVIVFMYGVSVYIGSLVPEELRASGQAAFAMATFVGASLLGNLLGGLLYDLCGASRVYLFGAALNLCSAIAFGYLILYRNKQHNREVLK